MKLQDDVKAFMKAAGQYCPDRPLIVPLDVRILRAKLILEEAFEQVEALGVSVTTEDDSINPCYLDENSVTYWENGSLDLVKVADGVADQLYVSLGCAIALGIDMEPIWDLVQAANVAKFGPGSYKRPDGKQMKPTGWVAPDEAIRDELKKQCLQPA